MAKGIAISPTEIRDGDVIAVAYRETLSGFDITKTKRVQKAEACGSKTGFVHLDKACYDPRFSYVVVPV